jgi:hypothetical protein
MTGPTVEERFVALPRPLAADEYNFEHFRAEQLARDARDSARAAGVQPGELAPDFTLPVATPRDGVGDALRLSDLRGQPVLLHFGSFT